MKLFDLTGRIALVTGSSRGIGLALARGLGAAGARVVLNGRRAEALAAAAKTLAHEGYIVSIARFDVTDEAAVEAAVADIEADTGPIEILINNAGMQFRAPLEDYPSERWRELFRLNVEATFLVGKAVARHMIGRGRGKIINIASVQSELARTGIAPYTATKGAVRQLTRGMCTDWARYGLQVNAIAPGYLEPSSTKPLSTIRHSRPGSRSARRPVAGAMSRSWWAQLSSSPRTPRASSMAIRSMSMAG